MLRGLCFILNVVSSTSNLGYAPSRVCVCCTTRASSTGLIGSVMTKAISIETALLAGWLAGLLADWPVTLLKCAFICDTLTDFNESTRQSLSIRPTTKSFCHLEKIQTGSSGWAQLPNTRGFIRSPSESIANSISRSNSHCWRIWSSTARKRSYRCNYRLFSLSVSTVPSCVRPAREADGNTAFLPLYRDDLLVQVDKRKTSQKKNSSTAVI